jgi:hypothetical protein
MAFRPTRSFSKLSISSVVYVKFSKRRSGKSWEKG